VLWSLVVLADMPPADVAKGNASAIHGMALGSMVGVIFCVVQPWLYGGQIISIKQWKRQSIAVWALVGVSLETLAWRVFGASGSTSTILTVGCIQGLRLGLVISIGLCLRRSDTQGWAGVGVLLGWLGAYVGHRYFGGFSGPVTGVVIAEVVAGLLIATVWSKTRAD
jgi:hypothetical protein